MPLSSSQTNNVTITPSSRLKFSFMTAADANLLYELDQDPAVMQYLTGGTTTSLTDIHTVFLPRLAKYADQQQGFGLWQVRLIETDEFLGWVLVRPMDFFSEHPQYQNLELGWRFKQVFWGKGYASEAASAVLNALAVQRGISQFSATALAENLGSIAVMKKLGMQCVKNYVHQDQFGDHQAVYYSVILGDAK
ncbi:GNAT family N-acetyltransferase [Pseudoalteromonas tunicata]|uniref:GNAT family N-acetyltransferase n=1 Tax=Pseudoalteromonas tunicata TaxID=314281 RepID=UPI00273D76E4|nr:GNAT family N-acetyltransferase [Pseudoalteromonas tunicata]MDP4983444.1 GNAT family N-acetyltransferase [Pseudoalteromonas tunicata]